jgi:transcription termination factor NusB
MWRVNMQADIFNKTFSPDYPKLARVCYKIGSDLNGRKDRFDKSDIIEQAVECITGGMLKWVDGEGYDNYCHTLDYKVEVKSEACALYTKKKKEKKKHVDLKLTNTLQNKTAKKALEETADDLLIVDSYHGAAAVVPYKVAINCSYEVADGFRTKIPTNEIEILYFPVDGEEPLACLNEGKSYKEEKKEAQRRFIATA